MNMFFFFSAGPPKTRYDVSEHESTKPKRATSHCTSEMNLHFLAQVVETPSIKIGANFLCPRNEEQKRAVRESHSNRLQDSWLAPVLGRKRQCFSIARQTSQNQLNPHCHRFGPTQIALIFRRTLQISGLISPNPNNLWNYMIGHLTKIQSPINRNYFNQIESSKFLAPGWFNSNKTLPINLSQHYTHTHGFTTNISGVPENVMAEWSRVHIHRGCAQNNFNKCFGCLTCWPQQNAWEHLGKPKKCLIWHSVFHPKEPVLFVFNFELQLWSGCCEQRGNLEFSVWIPNLELISIQIMRPFGCETRSQIGSNQDHVRIKIGFEKFGCGV